MIRRTVLAAALTLGLLTTSCLGPNHASKRLQYWNATVAEEDWVCELVFLGLNIIPVYGVTYLADVLVLNTIDFWSGENPAGEEYGFPHEAFGKYEPVLEPGINKGTRRPGD